MRTEDVQYLQLLERLRNGHCNRDDYELLLTRVVGQPSVGSLRASPWNKAPILVFRNEVRTQLNNKAVIYKAIEMGQRLIVCVAQDTIKGKQIEDPTLIKKLLELSDSKTEHLPGLLPLVPGMPVILTQNIAIELGLINGMNGIFRQLVYEEESVSTEVLSDTFPNNTQYIHRPLYALVEITKSKIECNLTSLQSNLVPIPLMEQTFQINITDVLPKDKRPKSNRKATLSIKRCALPLVPAYCITTHKSQGQTLNNVVIDLKLPKENDDIAAIYVPLPRVKRLADLVILRHFDYQVLLIKPNLPAPIAESTDDLIVNQGDSRVNLDDGIDSEIITLVNHLSNDASSINTPLTSKPSSVTIPTSTQHSTIRAAASNACPIELKNVNVDNSKPITIIEASKLYSHGSTTGRTCNCRG
ncbi:unnamed protein product, partial [Rotaria sp. Silwood1]